MPWQRPRRDLAIVRGEGVGHSLVNGKQKDREVRDFQEIGMVRDILLPSEADIALTEAPRFDRRWPARPTAEVLIRNNRSAQPLSSVQIRSSFLQQSELAEAW